VRKSVAAALLLFVILALVLTYPLALHLHDAVEDRQDALLNVWITAWDGHQLLTDPLHLFDANIFHPYARTLAYSELLLGNALWAMPITAVSGNPVLGYNIVLLLSFVLSGFGTFLLVRALTRSSSAGLVAGIIFSFSAYRMTNLAQAQLLTTQWMPFALLALVQLARQPRPRHAATFVLFFCLQVLSSFYYGILLALAVLGFVIWEFGIGVLRARDSRSGIRRRALAGYLLAAACCCALVVLPFALPYFSVQGELGFERTLADSRPFSASLRQYLMVAPGNVVHGQWLPSDDTPIAGGYPVDALFPGIIALALGAWGMVRGKGPTRWFFLLLLLASFVLSLGPQLYLAPGQPAGMDAELPYAWLYAFVPGFKALRAPVRFDALLMLALAVLAGYGTATLVDSRQQRASSQGDVTAGFLLASCALLLVTLESLVWPAAKAEQIPVGDQVPPVYRWLAAGADGATRPAQAPAPILELPMAFTSGGPQLDYQYYSTTHWRTTPDGYSGFVPPKHGQIVYEMERFPSERSVSLIQALGAGYLIIHTDRYPAARWAEMERALSEVSDLALVETFGADQVYQVQSRSFGLDDLEMTGYLPTRAVAGEGYIAYIIATNHGSRSYAVQPTDLCRPTVRWGPDESNPESTLSADIPLVTSGQGGVAVIPLPLTAPAKPGHYPLSIHEADGPLGPWSAVAAVEVGEQGDNAFPVPVRLESREVPPAARPGDSLSINLTWRALGKIDAYYSIYVKLLDAEGNTLVGWDGQPRKGEAPTLLWVPGERVPDTITLAVPGDAPPGDYSVEAGMYRAEDLARCLTLNAEGTPVDRLALGAVRIGP
jgi:hypothetical protein